PPGPAVVTVSARGLGGGTGNGPSPRRRFSRITCGGSDHWSGSAERRAIISTLSAKVSGAIASSAKSDSSDSLAGPRLVDGASDCSASGRRRPVVPGRSPPSLESLLRLCALRSHHD